MTVDDVKSSVARGALLGDPDDVIAACRRWEGAGVDQLIIELASPTLEDSLTTVRLFGDYVIPKFDTDPVHRTTRFRDAATAAR
jgi:alkanesulfonate monooxygenase SsuD/methylene tetrahydromethanopterin reductase-like flavin-dependent oxidoreductase (luciferase family)